MKQLDNVEYLFERFLRIQQTVSTLQSELQDLKSVFKLYFDKEENLLFRRQAELLFIIQNNLSVMTCIR